MIAGSSRAASVLIPLGLVLIGVWFVRVEFIAQSLKSHVLQLQALSSRSDLLQSCERVRAIKDDVVALDGELGTLFAVLSHLNWIPLIGNDLHAAPYMLNAARSVTHAGTVVCDALAKADVRDFSFSQIGQALAENETSMREASDAMAGAENAISQAGEGPFSPLLASRVAQLRRVLPAAHAAVSLSSFIHSLGGFDRPNTYLILALNEDELRPGGGFIAAAGEVRVENGNVTSMVFRDSYAVDDFSRADPNPPEPLRRFMGIDLWLFRDSNWSPDFPTAARQAIQMYPASGNPASIDGVIAIDQEGVQELVAAISPLQLPDSDEPITGENFSAYIRRAWAPSDGKTSGDWWLRRKSFMGPLAEAAFGRLASGGFRKSALADTLLRLLEGKHLQIFIEQPVVAAILHDQGWDGSLRRSSGDYLMVVDANMGYNKSNAVVRQSLHYQIDLRPSSPRGEITMVYTNTANVDYPCVPETRYDPVYEQMMNRCYWDYVQVYVPASAQLISATRVPIPAESLITKQPYPGDTVARATEEGGFLSLEQLILVPRGSAQIVRFQLLHRNGIVQWKDNQATYMLRIQKQAGAPILPVEVQILLPDNVRITDSRPNPITKSGSEFIFQLQLDRDQEIQLRFRRP